MSLPTLSRRNAFLIAAVLALVAIVAKAWISHALDRDLGYLLAWLAVIGSATLGGLLPGLLAGGLIAAADVLGVPGAPAGSPLAAPFDGLRLAIFIGGSALASFVIDTLRTARAAAEETSRRERDARIAAERSASRAASLTTMALAVATTTEPERIAGTGLLHGALITGAVAGLVATEVRGAWSALAWWPEYPASPEISADVAAVMDEVARSRTAQWPTAAATPGHAVVPFSMDDRSSAVAAWTYPAMRSLDESDRGALIATASMAALSIDRDSLARHAADTLSSLDAERRRLRALQSLTAKLSRSASSDEIALALAERGRAAAGARAIAVAFVDADGRLLLKAVKGNAPVAPSVEELGSEIIEGPLAEAVRRASPVFVVHREAGAANGGWLLAALPLLTAGVATGAVMWTFDAARPFQDREREFLRAIAGHGAQALDRARAFERVRRASSQEEISLQRLALMVEAGEVLGSALDYDAMLLAIGRVAIPMLGEFCVLDLVEGPIVRRLVATSDASRRESADALESHPIDLASSNPVAETIRSGLTQVFEIDEPLLERVTPLESHRRAVLDAGFRRVLIVPLATSAQPLGSLTFASTDPGRVYDEADRALAEGLGQRAARAVENARLNQELRRLAAHERDRAAELESVVAAIGEGIVVLDSRGRVRAQNDAARRMLGGAIAGQADLLERLDLAGDELLADRPLEPAEYRRSGGSHGWLEVSSYPLAHIDPDGGAERGSVLVLRDVTAFRQGQGLREAFLGLLSHELRTPVTSIYAAASVLGRPNSTLDAQVRGDILADIVAESDRLFRLTEDLLVLARFDEGLELLGEPHLLQHILSSVLAAERSRWPGVDLRASATRDLPAVSGDETSIQQVLRNLISNAAKYSPLDQTIEVVLTAEDGGVATRVLDHGQGIRAEEAEELFTPFFRSPDTAGLASGAGIGLFVCRRLVDAMGGRIWAAPRDGGGSEFGFWLPAYRAGLDDEDDDLNDASDMAAETAPEAARAER